MMAYGIYLTGEERAARVEIAARVNCVAKRGLAPGEPSIRALLREIAAGTLVVKRLAGRPKWLPSPGSGA